jgi:hypothetical protein
MPLRPGIFCGLLVLLGCATHAEPPAGNAQVTAPVSLRGTILAIRPVPVEPPGPVRVVLAGLGGPGASADGAEFEFIVRTQIGTTISVVQPLTGGLRAGDSVSIRRGAETRIDALVSN